MAKRVRGTVVYYEGEGDEAERVSVDDPKLSDLPKEVQEQESIQSIVYDDKDEDEDTPTRGHTTQVGTPPGIGPSEEERRKGAEEARAGGESESTGDESKKSSKKGKDS